MDVLSFFPCFMVIGLFLFGDNWVEGMFRLFSSFDRSDTLICADAFLAAFL